MKLKELVLEFGPPPGIDFSMNWDGPGNNTGVLVCQRAIVGHILRKAEYWIVGHEGVCVTGWIKNSQKSEFEDVCKAGVREFRKWKEISGNQEAKLAEWDEWKDELWREEDGGVRLVEVGVESGEVDTGPRKDDNMMGEPAWAVWPGSFVPECTCEVSCDLEGWSPED